MGLRVASLALIAVLSGCYLEQSAPDSSAGSAAGLVGETCRVGLDLPSGGNGPAVMSRDGLRAVSEVRGTVQSVGGGLIQVDTGKSLLWLPLERVLYIEREK